MFDSHCHLDFPEFDSDRAELLADARRQGIVGFVVPGVHAGLWSAQEALKSEPDVYLAAGLHPWWLPEAGAIDVTLAELEARARRIGAVAIGECGLDAKRSQTTLADQVPWFEGQLDLARTLQLPVILHQVGAREEFLRVLERVGRLPRAGVVHAFSGDADWARALLARGFFLGFGASLSAPNRHRLRQALLAVPEDRLLLETDAPAGSRPGQRSVPADLVSICREVAGVRALPAAQVAQQCDANLATLFGIARALEA